MRIVERYIFSQFGKYFLAIFIVSILMVWLTQSLRFIEFITVRGVSVYIFLKITIQLIIPMIYVVLPVTAMIAVIALISHFNHDKEIVIFRNAGMSDWQVLQPIAKFCAVLMFLHILISFYFLPKTYRDFKDSREYYKNKFVSLLLEEGAFNTQSNSLTVYIDEKIDDNYFNGIFINDMQNPSEPVTIIAESGYILSTDAGPEFVLYNGSHQKKDKNSISITTFDSYKFSMHKYDAKANAQRTFESNELYINQLFSFSTLDEKQIKINLVNGNQRILWPIFTLLLPLLVGATVLMGQYSRRTAIKRNSIGAGVGLIFVVLSMLLNSLATKHLWMLSLMNLNLVVVFLVTRYLLKDKVKI